MVLPREAMGFGGCEIHGCHRCSRLAGAVFSLMASSLIGSMVGVTLIYET